MTHSPSDKNAMPERIWAKMSGVWRVGLLGKTESFVEYIRADLAPPSDKDEYKALCEDLDRAHEHIKLYVEAEERNTAELEKVRSVANQIMLSAQARAGDPSQAYHMKMEAMWAGQLYAIIEKKGA